MDGRAMRSQRLIVPPPAGHADYEALRPSLFLEGVSGSIVSKTIVKSFKNAPCAYYSRIGLHEVHKLVSRIGLHEVHKLVSRRSLSSRPCAPCEWGLGTVP